MEISFKPRTVTLVLAAALGVSALLIACGGGGGSSGAGGTSNSPVVIGGTISGGAAWPQGSHVVMTDSTGATVCDTTITGTDGSYTCTIASTAKAPLVVTATQEDKEPMVSVCPLLTAGIVNVNPATHAVAALLVNGDPNDPTNGVAALIQTTPELALPERVTAQQNAILDTYTRLAPNKILPTQNPFTSTLTTDGKGMDAVLDNVKIVVTPTGSGAATMAVTTTATRDDATPAPSPLVLNLSGNAAEAAPAPSTVVTADAAAQIKVTDENAVAAGTTGKINDLLARLTACYAEPQSTRISAAALLDPTHATAFHIVSDTCKTLFVGNDPANYKNNSYVVSGTQAFSSIFTLNTGLGVQFSQGNYEYTVKSDNTNANQALSGDVVFTTKWVAPFDGKNPDGVTERLNNSGVEVYTARPDANGKLFLIGNLSGVDISVEPRAEFRDFTHADMRKYSYINTGYNIFFNAKHGFGKVVVTTPKGGTLTLKQIAGGGYGYMGLSKPSEAENTYTAVPTSVLRLAAAYVDPTTTSNGSYCGASENHPRDIDGTLFWTCNDATHNKNWTDTELAAIPDQGTWKFVVYYDWADSTPAFTTYRRTLRRAPTLAEITAALPSWPSLTSNARAKITEVSTGGGIRLSVDSPEKFDVSSPNGGPAWQVPSNAKWAPRSVKIYGKDSLNNNAGFEDGVDVYSSWRKAIIGCSSERSDLHCDGTNVNNGRFKQWDDTLGKGVGVGQVQFNGYDARRVLNSLSIIMRKN